MKRMVITFLILMSLTRCVGVLIAGAAVGTIVHDSRNFVEMERDARIFYLVNKAIIKSPRFRFSSVDVSVFNQVVLLTGQVSMASLKIIAEKIARKTPNVDRVYNQLEVDEPLSVSQKTLDRWITSQVKARMLAEKGLKSGAIKVVTNNGAVYLMGIVKKSQAMKAVKIARSTNRVKKVVKVFLYIV